MKKTIVLLWILCAVAMGHGAVTSSVLFSDNFDRPDNVDIDASSAGMGGSAAPMVYQEAFEGSGQASSIQVLSNQLDIAVGAGMSSLYLDHNFVDADIINTDGFSVTLEVASITSADDQGNRFGGFGVGNTQAEAAAAGDSFDSAGPLRPALFRADQGFGVSDFYVDLALDQNIRLWSNGALLNTIPVGAAFGTIAVDFFVTDFNAGSTVTAVVYFNGDQQDIQVFTWDNTDTNYLGISGRTAGAGVFLDNLEVAAIYNDRAQNPNPDGTILIPAGTLNLQWDKGKDASGNPNADIDQHYVYITDETYDGEPNFAALDAEFYTVADTADPVIKQITVANDELKYWRVDESILVEGIASGPDDPNTITGLVWQFETERSVPVIDPDGQPENVIRYPYTDSNYEGDAVFTCAFNSINPVNVDWYRTADPNNAIDDVDTDITMTLDQVGTDYTATLTISNVESADEDAYYCEIAMQTGTEDPVVSDSADLGVRRNVAHWTLNQSDLQGGQYLDISGQAHHAEPNIVPGGASFVDGVDPAETGDGLDLTVEPLAAADSGDWSPAMYTGEITISAWLNWAGANGSWQGVVSNRVAPPPAMHNFYIEIRQDNGNLQIGGLAGVGDLQISPLPTAEWAHLAITVRAGQAVMYINGQALNTNTAVQAVTQNSAPLYMGALGRNASGTLLNSFNGTMDDIQLYNYALSDTQVVDLYYDILETAVCLNPNDVNLQFDVAGGGLSGDEPDCQVNLSDFAVFAQTWMNCGQYPQSECQ